MTEEFKGLHIVVTGGAGELGSAVVEALVPAGAVCHLPVRTGGGLQLGPAGVAGLSSERVRIAPGVDLTDEALVSGFYAQLPGLWASIHCAGGFDAASVTETSLAALDKQLALNLRTAFLCSREAVKRLRAGGAGGRIVNVAAEPAISPRAGAGKTAYTASKGAVAAFTLALAEEVGGEGILVNAVAPFTMDTAANRCAMPGADSSRWAKLPDVAAAIAFLVSPANRVVRGGLVPVPGGG